MHYLRLQQLPWGLLLHFFEVETYKNQSIARISPMSSVGRFTAWRTIIMVTRPADGMPAAPIAAAVAVKLAGKLLKKTVQWLRYNLNSEKICASQYFLESISHVPLERETRSRGGGRCNIWSHYLSLEQYHAQCTVYSVSCTWVT